MDVKLQVDLTEPQHLIDSLRELSRYLAKELRAFAPENCEAIGVNVSDYSKQLRPSARVMFEEIADIIQDIKPVQ